METLKEYFKKNQITYSRWAKSIGVAPPVLCRYLSGKTALSPRNAKRISDATKGEVSVLDLLYPQDHAA